MKHAIDTTDAGVRITAEATGASQKALLDELAKCAAGTCSCPSTQYDKLAAIEVSAGESAVTVDLKVKPGESVDLADIERCLDHTAKVAGA